MASSVAECRAVWPHAVSFNEGQAAGATKNRNANDIVGPHEFARSDMKADAIYTIHRLLIGTEIEIKFFTGTWQD
jgi:hypothetical protein